VWLGPALSAAKRSKLIHRAAAAAAQTNARAEHLEFAAQYLAALDLLKALAMISRGLKSRTRNPTCFAAQTSEIRMGSSASLQPTPS